MLGAWLVLATASFSPATELTKISRDEWLLHPSAGLQPKRKPAQRTLLSRMRSGLNSSPY